MSLRRPKSLIFITEVATCGTQTRVNPALQAGVESKMSSASCASLACGYEDNALRAGIFNGGSGQIILLQIILNGQLTMDKLFYRK
jgi:hypothetical protein